MLMLTFCRYRFIAVLKQPVTRTPLYVAMVSAWCISLFISVFNVIIYPHMILETDSLPSTVCLPMNFSGINNEAYFTPTLILCVVYGVALAAVSLMYLQILIIRKRSETYFNNGLRHTAKRNSRAVYLKILVLITNNFICWFPTIVIGFVSSAGVNTGAPLTI